MPGPRGAERAGEPGRPRQQPPGNRGRQPSPAPGTEGPAAAGARPRAPPAPERGARRACGWGRFSGAGNSSSTPVPLPSSPRRGGRDGFIKRNKSLPIWRRWVGSLCGLCLAVWAPRVSARARTPGAPGSPRARLYLLFLFPLALCVSFCFVSLVLFSFCLAVKICTFTLQIVNSKNCILDFYMREEEPTSIYIYINISLYIYIQIYIKQMLCHLVAFLWSEASFLSSLWEADGMKAPPVPLHGPELPSCAGRSRCPVPEPPVSPTAAEE